MKTEKEIRRTLKHIVGAHALDDRYQKGKYDALKWVLEDEEIKESYDEINKLKEAINQTQRILEELTKRISILAIPEPEPYFCLERAIELIQGYTEETREIPVYIIREYNKIVSPEWKPLNEYKEKSYVCATTKAYIEDLYISIERIKICIKNKDVISFELLSEYNLNCREVNSFLRGAWSR